MEEIGALSAIIGDFLVCWMA